MRDELEEQIYKAGPKLYRQKDLPMSQTCMCWGIATRDGWFDIIMDLTKKLEELINKYLLISNHDTCFCGCDELEHNIDGKCTKVFKIPYQIDVYRCFTIPKSKLLYKWKKFCSFIFRKINAGLRVISPIIHKNVPCTCKKYERSHPCASQVKEKFGTLRFYMDGYTDEIHDLINEAEKQSAHTCEICGKPGKLVGKYWVNTFCEECEKAHNKEKYGE